MASVRTVSLRRSVLLCGCALGVLGWMAVGDGNAQSADPGKSGGSAAPMAAASQNSGLDMEATPAAPVAAASQNGGLDMDAGSSTATAGPASSAPMSTPARAPVLATVAAAPASGTLPAAPTASVAAGGVASSALAGTAAAASAPVTASAPGSVTLPRDNVQDGVHFALVNPGPVAAPAGSLTAPSGAPPAAPSGTPPTAPSGTSSATPSGTPTAPLLGTVVEPGSTQPPAVAATASLASPPAPAEPINLDHPTVIDTDTLKAGDTTVSLYGIEGIQGEAAQGMQGFLAANAGRVTCQAQSAAGGFVCLLPDGTDVAEVALVNGAARVKDDAPPAYQEQEAAAQGARRGIWADLPPPPATVTHPTVQDTATLVSAGQTYRLDGIVGLAAPYAGQLQGYIEANGDALTCQPQGGEGSYICMLRDGTDIAKIALVNGAARVGPDATDSYRVQQGDALNNHRGFWLNPPADVLLAVSTVQVVPVCCALVAGDDGVDGITYVGGMPEAVIDGAPEFLVYGGDAGWGYYDHFHHWHGAPDRFRRHLEHYHPAGYGLRGYGHDEALRHDAVHREEVGRRDDVVRREDGLRRDAALHPVAVHPGAVHPGGVVAHSAAPGYHPGFAGRPGVGAGFHPAGGFVHPGPSVGGFHPAAVSHPTAAAHVAVSSGGGKRR